MQVAQPSSLRLYSQKQEEIRINTDIRKAKGQERGQEREKKVGNASDEWWAEGQDRTGQEGDEEEEVRKGWKGTWGVDRRPSLCMAFSSTHVFALASLFLSNAKFKQFYVRTSAKRRSRSDEMLKISDSSRCR
jgi:hypothetical protein